MLMGRQANIHAERDRKLQTARMAPPLFRLEAKRTALDALSGRKPNAGVQRDGYVTKHVTNRVEGKKQAERRIAAMPEGKRYITRVLDSLDSAFADFDTETAKLDLPNMQNRKPEAIKRYLAFRLRQFKMLLDAVEDYVEEKFPATGGHSQPCLPICNNLSVCGRYRLSRHAKCLPTGIVELNQSLGRSGAALSGFDFDPSGAILAGVGFNRENT
jgi:hypothetical protein